MIVRHYRNIIETMSDLTMAQIMSMTDEELLMDLVKSGDVDVCEKCGVPLQRTITGYNNQGQQRRVRCLL